MSESWDDWADGWDDNADVRVYAEKAFRSLVEVVDLEGLRILDFGCGTGLLSEKMSPLATQIVALDPSSGMVSVLRDKNIGNVVPLVAALSDDTIESEAVLHDKFDLIVASSVCAFLPDYRDTLRLMQSLLVPGGVFVQWDWLAAEEGGFGFTEGHVSSALTDAGFAQVQLRQPFSLESEKGTMSVLQAIARNG